MSVRSLPPAKTPDMTAQLNTNYSDGVVGSKGEKVMTGQGAHQSGQDLMQNPDKVWKTNNRVLRRDIITLSVDALPNFKARRVNIRIAVSEEAASLKMKKWFRRVRFQLPQNQISLGAVKSQRPLAIADADDVAVTLSFFTKLDASTYRAGVLLSNQNGANWKWKIQSATLGDMSDRSSMDFGNNNLMWAKGGRPVQDGEENVHLEFDSFGAPGTKSPVPISEMRLELTSEKRQARVINFRNLPIPRGKQSLSVNRTVKFASGAQFTIRKIESGTFDDAQQRIQSNEQPTKIAITYDTNAQADSDRWIEYEQSTGVDNSGNDLGTSGTTQAGQTLYFVPPPRGAKSFDLRLLLAEVTRGPRRTVVFHSLPTPTVKPKAKPQAK